MKKIILALVALFAYSNVSALTGQECTPFQLEEGRSVLANVSYTLEYANNYADMNGDFQEGHMRIKFPDLPAGYSVVIISESTSLQLFSSEQFGFIDGGVNKVVFFSDQCDTIIKSYEMRAPHYKRYCGVDIKCEDDAWFDGTFENSLTNQNAPKKSKLSIKLVVILVVLVIIIVLFVVMAIKRRKDREKDL